MSNDKTYTEVLLDVYDRIDIVEQRIVSRLDVITKGIASNSNALARGDSKFKAIEDKLDGKGGLAERVDTNASDIKSVRNLNAFIALLGSTIAGIIGTQK